MAQYRQEVRRVLELLSALVQPYDPDGLDLYFSTSNARLKPKSNKEMLDIFDEQLFYGIPDFRDRFSTIIQRFQDQLGKKNLFSKIRHPKSTPSKGPRRLSLYVLTDGVWQPKGELVEEMRTLVDQLKRHGLPHKYIGIQFIRFGRDTKGKQRLRTLDEGTTALGLKL